MKEQKALLHQQEDQSSPVCPQHPETFSDGGAYANLAMAICMQGVRDWKRATDRVRKHPENQSARATVEETEAFFCSEWFHMLSGVDGEWLLQEMIRQPEAAWAAWRKQEKERRCDA